MSVVDKYFQEIKNASGPIRSNFCFYIGICKFHGKKLESFLTVVELCSMAGKPCFPDCRKRIAVCSTPMLKNLQIFQPTETTKEAKES
ncbi:hypothetical protein HY988_00385 [Candidatus Micrarchaeota archaeon]|nr:hypothetical protein [Candidatus Micrarchaeota archaeon]